MLFLAVAFWVGSRQCETCHSGIAESYRKSNILTPPNPVLGNVPVTVTAAGLTSAAATVAAKPLTLSFFVFGGGPYVAADHADGALLGPKTLYPGLTTPAKPGETVVLFANGFRPDHHPGSQRLDHAGRVAFAIAGGEDRRHGRRRDVRGSGRPGEFQFNVVVPSSLPDGDQPVVATYGGSATPSGMLLAVQH